MENHACWELKSNWEFWVSIPKYVGDKDLELYEYRPTGFQQLSETFFLEFLQSPLQRMNDDDWDQDGRVETQK